MSNDVIIFLTCIPDFLVFSQYGFPKSRLMGLEYFVLYTVMSLLKMLVLTEIYVLINKSALLDKVSFCSLYHTVILKYLL